ncbi:hypothetical protein ACG04Q_17465 [Roseateles sp. DXS20W]|uniref:Lipoprotein n=1 Tax=Pelomonas lactea TaxID=3299030 RepID=A0ABW7GN33_9BURK
MSKVLLMAALVVPLLACAQVHHCDLKRVTIQARAEDEKEPVLTVYAFWPEGLNITRADGTPASNEYATENARYLRDLQTRKRTGEKPIPPPAILLKGPHFILRSGDEARARRSHVTCSYLAKAETGGLVLELTATYCEHGQCATATKVIAPELEQP